MQISNCCSAPVYDDTDICTACKEHCTVIEEEDETTCSKCGADLETQWQDLDNEGQFREVITTCPNGCDV